jgi:N-acetylmuramoyl-L-alanine amidase
MKNCLTEVSANQSIKNCVDIFGATSNTNWITQLSTLKKLKMLIMNKPKMTVSCYYRIESFTHWGYSIYYEEKKLDNQNKKTA